MQEVNHSLLLALKIIFNNLNVLMVMAFKITHLDQVHSKYYLEGMPRGLYYGRTFLLFFGIKSDCRAVEYRRTEMKDRKK